MPETIQKPGEVRNADRPLLMPDPREDPQSGKVFAEPPPGRERALRRPHVVTPNGDVLPAEAYDPDESHILIEAK